MTSVVDPTPDGIRRPVVASPKRRRWDRPRPPRDWRYWVGGTGRILMAVGLLMFGFVAYQLWGTGIEYRQNQHSLERDFERQLAALATSTTTATTTTATTTVPASTTTTGSTTAPAPSSSAAPTTAAPTPQPAAAVPWPQIQLGDVIAEIRIPKIGKRVFAVAGIRTEDLKKGLGHYPDTPLPGQLGNTAFAGHRTTYGAPLFDIDQLHAGDEIIVTTITNQRYVYKMVGEAQIVSPHDYGVIRNSDPNKAMLTLTSCHPRYSASKRIVIHAELDPSQSGPVSLATPFYGQTVDPSSGPVTSDDTDVITDSGGDGGDDGQTTSGGEIHTTVDTAAYEGAEGLSRGWFHDSGAWLDVAGWGAALALLAVGGYLLDRKLHRYWPGIVAAALPFVVALYFFYQNVNRLLPPDL